MTCYNSAHTFGYRVEGVEERTDSTTGPPSMAPEEKEQCRKPKQAQPQWAWLPHDRCENVYISVIQDLDAIFLQLIYFSDCLQNLVRDIQKYASTQKKDDNCKSYLEVGDVCLGKPSGSDEWNRAMIKSKPAEDMVELFFVDYGDSDVIPWSSVMSISNQLITKLPFQVIESYLAGVKFQPPSSGKTEWEDDVIVNIYNLSRKENEEALNLRVKVCSVEASGKYTNGKRYKVVLVNDVDPDIIINSQLIAFGFAQLFEEDKLLENVEIPVTKNDDNTSECGESVTSTSKLEVVPVAQNSDVALSNKYDVDDELAKEENNKKVEQFLKEFEEGDFDCSIFHGLENDADVSDNTSEGSFSLPRSRGHLPETSSTRLQLPPLENEDSVSCSSDTILSSQNSSTVSLNQEKQNNKLSEQKNCNKPESLLTVESFSPSNNGGKLSPVKSPSGSQFYESTPYKITGVANNFKDLVSPNFRGLPSTSSSSSSLNLVRKISPFIKRVSHGSPPIPENVVCGNLDDNEHFNIVENTMSELNPDLKTKTYNCDEKSILGRGEKSTHQTTDMEPDVKENGKKKSPCQKWVECVIPDSDEDLTLLSSEISATNGQEAENCDTEIRTPLVEWHQDDNCVFLYIKLPSVTEYQFCSDITSVHFKATYGGMSYEVNLPELYGGHKSEKAQGTAKACYFEIRLEKLLKGKRRHWPRLTRVDNKFHWLKLNAEKTCEGLTDSEDEDVKRLACSLPLWNENPVDSESIASSDRSELANSELSL